MSPEQLLQKTKEYLPEFSHACILPINTGGSDRKFYRLLLQEKQSLVLVHYNNDREENKLYATHALFLKSHSLHIPAVIKHSPKEGLLWLQDLGEIDLFNEREQPWEKRRPLYEATLVEAARFHRIPIESPAEAGILLEKEFNEELYRWEQDYFLEHALGNLFNIDKKTREKLSSSAAFQLLAASLATLPRQLIHRDLQSQNVMIYDNKAWLIDFQGFRAGLAEYDLASLLYDPYVTMTEAQREELLDFYQQEMQHHGISPSPDFKKTFLKCAAQRLMQALGAYGYISLQLGKTHYRDYVSPALTRLCEILKKLPEEDQLPELEEVLEKISF